MGINNARKEYMKKKLLLIILSLLIITCSKEKKNIEPQSYVYENENTDTDVVVYKNYNKKIMIDTIPTGASVFWGLDRPSFTTPVELNLADLKYDKVLRFERLRYFTEEIEINADELLDKDTLIIPLKENKAFVDDYYLSYSRRQQADGITKEFCRYIYDENAKLIRIDSYIHELEGYYNITLDEQGRIKTKQFNGIDGHVASAEKVEYNEDGIPIPYIGDDYELFIYVEYGDKDSEYTKRVTEKYFSKNTPEEKRKEYLETHYFSGIIYTYQ